MKHLSVMFSIDLDTIFECFILSFSHSDMNWCSLQIINMVYINSLTYALLENLIAHFWVFLVLYEEQVNNVCTDWSLYIRVNQSHHEHAQRHFKLVGKDSYMKRISMLLVDPVQIRHFVRHLASPNLQLNDIKDSICILRNLLPESTKQRRLPISILDLHINSFIDDIRNTCKFTHRHLLQQMKMFIWNRSLNHTPLLNWESQLFI